MAPCVGLVAGMVALGGPFPGLTTVWGGGADIVCMVCTGSDVMNLVGGSAMDITDSCNCSSVPQAKLERFLYLASWCEV